MNIFTYQYNKAKNRCYVAFKKFKNTNSPVNLPVNNLLITYQPKQLYDLIKTNYNTILKETLTDELIGDYKEKDFYTKLLDDKSLHIEPPVSVHPSKNVFSRIKDQLNKEKAKKTKKLTCEPDRSIKKQVKLDQKEDIKKLYNFVKSELKFDSEKFFEWNDKLDDFIKNDIKKKNPNFWIEKLKENKVLEEPILGKLRFLDNFGGANQ